MEFLGVGPLELLFILIIILLVFGPKDIERGARTLGRGLNRLYRSENYKMIQKASEELRHLPERLAREANLEELEALKKMTEQELRNLKNAADPGLPEKPFQAWVEELPQDPTDTPSPAPSSAAQPPTPKDTPST